MRSSSRWDPRSPCGAEMRGALSRARTSRRGFLGTLAAAAAALGLPPRATRAAPALSPRLPHPPEGGPRCISSANGVRAVARALEAITTGSSSPLEAAVAGVNLVEEDPEDITVGLGGLPNEDGVVQLDSAVMDGRTHRAGAVAALERIATPSRVALRVLERTDHVLLVGRGALRFARAHGFAETELLTDRARKIWLHWKETLSRKDDWLSSTRDEDAAMERPTGTIHLSLLDAGGNVACVTTTSGLAFKIPGRVGDSPLVGAGLYCTNEAGSCGSTGRGESVILECGSFAVVEWMRLGHPPREACLEVLSRVERHAPARHRDPKTGRPLFDVKFYALSTSGAYAGAALQPNREFAVADPAGGARKEPCVSLLEAN